jgi:hypothetical protein
MMHQLSAKSKREEGQYKTLPLTNADKRGSAQIRRYFLIQDRDAPGIERETFCLTEPFLLSRATRALLAASEGRWGEAIDTADHAVVGYCCRRTGGVEARSEALLIDRSIRTVRCSPSSPNVRSERTISYDARLRHELHLVSWWSQGVVGGSAGGTYISGDGAAVLCRTAAADDQNAAQQKGKGRRLSLHNQLPNPFYRDAKPASE